MIRTLGALASCTGIALLFVVILLNWLMGCGQGGACWLIGGPPG